MWGRQSQAVVDDRVTRPVIRATVDSSDSEFSKTNAYARRGKREDWVQHNPIPLRGEICTVLNDDCTEVLEFRIGDGATSWSDLPSYTQQG